MMWGYGGWNWVWMGPAMAVFWGALAVLAIWAFRAIAGPTSGGSSAIEVLRMRLASGEITQDEYNDTKRTLLDKPDLL